MNIEIDTVFVWTDYICFSQGDQLCLKLVTIDSDITYNLKNWKIVDFEGKEESCSSSNLSLCIPYLDSKDWHDINEETALQISIITDKLKVGFKQIFVDVECVDPKGNVEVYEELAYCHIGIRPKIISKNDIALLVPTFTLQAYNDLGNLSFYKPVPRQMPGERSVKMTRPLPNRKRGYHSVTPAVEFERTIRSMGFSPYPLESIDIHKFELARLLELPQILITAHDEYLTLEQRQNLHNYVRLGGRLSIFCGNFCWWKIRVEEDDYISVCKAAKDETENVDDRRGIWANRRVGTDPSEDFILTFRHGGYPLKRYLKSGEEEIFDLSDDELKHSGGMRVLNDQHPIFTKTGLKNGDWFGFEENIVDVEIDGIPFDDDLKIVNELKSLASDEASLLGSAVLIRLLGGKMIVRPATIAELEFPDNDGRLIHLGSCCWFRAANTQSQANSVLKNVIAYQMDKSS